MSTYNVCFRGEIRETFSRNALLSREIGDKPSYLELAVFVYCQRVLCTIFYLEYSYSFARPSLSHSSRKEGVPGKHFS